MNTKLRNKKIIFLLICIMIIGICIGITKNINIIQIIDVIKEKFVGPPINENNEINNSFFGIADDFTKPRETLKGINEAIKYASKDNINYIKLKKGKYLIDGTNNTNLSKGIEIEVSNITIDLNGSTIKYIENNKPVYNVIKLLNVENVNICNGVIIGDKDKHDYGTIQSSHGFGCGISINACKNIKIENMEIYNMTGDGIYIGDLFNKKNGTYDNSMDCSIVNNNINNCRRLGIAVTGGTNIKIEKNEIYNIDGVWPKAGICIEANENEIIDKITIKDNKIYTTASNDSIIASKNTQNVLIIENELNGGILGLDVKCKIKIINNKIKSGDLEFKISEELKKSGFYVKEVLIQKNNVQNGKVILKDIERGEVLENTFINCEFDLEEGKVIFNDNDM